MSKQAARQVAIEAKHLRPRLEHVSLQPRAVEVLGPAFLRRLTVICAPAGYGKTTTTAAALEHCGHTSSWYKLDILDHDPLAFLASMTRAVQRIHPEFGAALLRELESGPVTDLPVEVLAARFCSECDRLVSADVHLVLDDYHEAMDSPALNDVLGYLLENCPSSVHFVVLTRYEPAFRLEKLHLAGDVSRVPRDLFMFDLEQVTIILAERSGRLQDPENVRRLHQLTEGWPASVVLAGMALAWLDVTSLEEALADPRLRTDMFSYLAEQVFKRQSEEVQRFMLSTCCLEHITSELAEILAGSQRASRHLHYLARNHVFTFATDRVGAYRYHNLLRDFLRQRFVHDEGEAAFRVLQRRTAVALEDCGDQPGAVELLLSANELELALGVVSRGGEALLERRPYQQLRSWSDQVAPLREMNNPWSFVVCGILAARDSQYEDALANLRSAEAILKKATGSAGLYEVLSITEWTEFWSGDADAAMETCRRALDLARSEGQRLHTLLSMLSCAVDARRWSVVDDTSQKVSPLLPNADAAEVARAQALRAHAAYYRGDMRAAQSLMTNGEISHQTGSQLASSLNTQGMIHLALGLYEVAGQAFNSAVEVADDFGQAIAVHMIEDNIALLEASLGQFDTAKDRLHRLLSQADELDPSILGFVMTHHGTVLRRNDEVEASLEPTSLACEVVPLDRDPYLALNSRTNLAFSEGLLGRETAGRLRSLSRSAEASGLQFVELKALLFAAVLESEAGSSLLALRLMESCIPRQLSLGHVNLLAQELCPRGPLVAELLRHNHGRSWAAQLLLALSVNRLFSETLAYLEKTLSSGVREWIERELETTAFSAFQQKTDKGESYSSPPVLPNELTGREMEVLELMASDKSNEEIAQELYIAVSTVKTHVNHILRKLEQKTRVGAILEYQRLVGQSPPSPQARIHPRYDSGGIRRH